MLKRHNQAKRSKRAKKAPFICYPRISYFGHACKKKNLVLISRLTGKCAKHILKRWHIMTYQGDKINGFFNNFSLNVSL